VSPPARSTIAEVTNGPMNDEVSCWSVRADLIARQTYPDSIEQRHEQKHLRSRRYFRDHCDVVSPPGGCRVSPPISSLLTSHDVPTIPQVKFPS